MVLFQWPRLVVSYILRIERVIPYSLGWHVRRASRLFAFPREPIDESRIGKPRCGKLRSFASVVIKVLGLFPKPFLGW